MLSRVARVAGVRAGEGRMVGMVGLLFVALEAGRGFGEVGADTLVVSRFGAGILPYLIIGLGAVSLVSALAYGAALGRIARTPLLIGVLLGASTLLVLGRLLVATGTVDVLPVIWLVTFASGAIAGTIAWTVAGSVFDARQAKRLFPLCTGAAIAGSFVGSVASGTVAGAAGTETLILLEAILLGVVAILVASISRSGRARVPAPRRRSIVLDLRVGFDEVVRSPLFRLVALAYVLFSILEFSVKYPFLQSASAAFPTETDLATAIGLLSAAVTATSFVISLTLANRVYARFGVAGAALVLPLVYLAGFGLWLVQFSFATAALVRFTQQTSQRGISNAAWSAFYNVVPGERRAQVLAFVDGVPGQIGMVIAGLLLLGAGRVFAADQVFWLGAIAALGLTAVVVAIRRRYGASLIRTLRGGLGEQVLEGGPGLSALALDPQVGAVLTTALEAPEPAVRRMAAAMLGRLGAPGAATTLIRVLADPDARVRIEAVGGLAALPREARSTEAAMALLGDPEAGVRAAAVRALGQLEVNDIGKALAPVRDDADARVAAAVAVALDGLDGADGAGQVASEGVRRLMADPSDEVRHAVIEEVAAVGGLRRAETIAPLLLHALDDDSARVRRTAAGLLARRESETEGVLDVLINGSARAQDAALLALLGHGNSARDVVLEWAERQLHRAAEWRGARLSLVPAATSLGPDTSLSFLVSVIARRERHLADRTLGALAVLGATEARGVIRRCLGATNQETRAQALEALDSIGERRLSRAVATFLDAETGGAASPPAMVLSELVGIDDPWVGALAKRAIADIAGTGGGMETGRLVGEIDTMLLLRRVPLFEGLEPEDLQRIATTCSERSFQAGDAIVREGDVGNELFVLISGTVRVVRDQPDGSVRSIRTYGPGDHIGELAVLRDRPRAGTVLAEDDVRAMVIDGENLKAILRERPEAAMAMLATLAERISAQ